MQKKLLRNKKEGMVAGVGSGLSDYFGLDASLWRLAFIFLTVMTAGAFIIVYLAAWMIVPKGTDSDSKTVIHDV